MTTNNKIADDVKDEIYSLWLLGEMAFTILPIMIVVIVNIAYSNGKSLVEVFLLPDWSFGSVVLFGIAISQLIEIKTKYQKDPSHKLYTGTRMFTILVIFSAVILTLSVARQQGANINSWFIGISQFLLFFLSSFSIYIAISTKQMFLNVPRLKSTLSSKTISTYLTYSLEEAEQSLYLFIKTAESHKDQSDINREDLIHLVKKIEKNLQVIETSLKEDSNPPS